MVSALRLAIDTVVITAVVRVCALASTAKSQWSISREVLRPIGHANRMVVTSLAASRTFVTNL